VVGGRVFLGGRSAVALDAKLGCTIWEFKTEAPVRATIKDPQVTAEVIRQRLSLSVMTAAPVSSRKYVRNARLQLTSYACGT